MPSDDGLPNAIHPDEEQQRRLAALADLQAIRDLEEAGLYD